jgi:hypothetical protein
MANGTQGTMQKPMAVSDMLPPVNPFLGLIPSDAWDKFKQYFAFNFPFIPLGASSTGVLSVNVDSSADFVGMLATTQCTSTDETQKLAYFPALAQFALTAGATVFSDQTFPLGSLAPDASSPMYLPYPMYIPANSTLTLTLQNLEATSRNYRVTLHGFKVYPQQSQ